MHCFVEVTELSTNKQHTVSLRRERGHPAGPENNTGYLYNNKSANNNKSADTRCTAFRLEYQMRWLECLVAVAHVYAQQDFR